jgi:hypothetical protein
MHDQCKGSLDLTSIMAVSPPFSAADVCVGSQIGWGLAFGTMEKRESFVAYAARDQDAWRGGDRQDALGRNAPRQACIRPRPIHTQRLQILQ